MAKQLLSSSKGFYNSLLFSLLGILLLIPTSGFSQIRNSIGNHLAGITADGRFGMCLRVTYQNIYDESISNAQMVIDLSALANVDMIIAGSMAIYNQDGIVLNLNESATPNLNGTYNHTLRYTLANYNQ